LRKSKRHSLDNQIVNPKSCQTQEETPAAEETPEAPATNEENAEKGE
jgi:hypothetical protein